MMRFPQRAGYWCTGLALVLVAAFLGLSGHGLPALGVRLLNGEAWLGNVANRSVSLIDGYSGKLGVQVGLPGMTGRLQVVNTPGGAVVTDQHGHLIKVSNDNFTTGGPIRLFGGSAATAAAGQHALYAIDLATGQIQQLNAAGPRLASVGPPVSVGRPITSPVVAPDGSLYFAIPGEGSAGHVAHGRLATIAHVGRPRDMLRVVLAGTLPVAADLTAGTVVRLGSARVNGRAVRLPASFNAVRVAGSDTGTGLVGAVSDDAVDSVNAVTGAISTTRLPFRVAASAAAMIGQTVVLINSARRDVLIVNTATHLVRRPVTIPGTQVPDELTVSDRLVFVNASEGDSALVINGSGQIRKVTKYTGPPPVKHPAPVHAPVPGHAPAPTTRPPARHQGAPRRPGAPRDPVATPGNASVSVGWDAAADNGSALSAYQVTWAGSDGSAGHVATRGSALGAVIKGLSNGISYVFTVAAVNGIGQGPSSRTARVTPSSSIPGAPAGLTALASQPDGSITLKWTAADHGYHVGSYTIWQSGATVPLLSGVTATTATVGASQGLVPGTPAQFQVSAVGTSGASGPRSAASAAVTPYLAPAAPNVKAQVAPAGTSATLSVSCPASCQQGRPPKTYQVTVSPGGSPVTAVAFASGAAVSVPVTGLDANSSYTAAVTVTDSAGATGAPASVAITTPGPPSVAAVGGTASGLSLNVTATVGSGGLSVTCSVTANGASQSGACSAISIGVPTYDTSYPVTFSATNADGTATASGTVKSGLKALTADATDAFGTCPASNPPPFCGGNSHMEPTPNFVKNNGAPEVFQGAQEQAGCWTTGGVDKGTVAPYTGGSDVWVYMPGQGYMSILWFPDPNSVTVGLPQASSC